MNRRWSPVVGALGLVMLAACGAPGTDSSVLGGSSGGELTGYRREPAPVVAGIELPDLANDGKPFELRAEPGELLVIYFGYINCPDFCPTTLSDVRLARQQLDTPELVDVAMVSVDPARDLPVLVDYVNAFVDGAHALGTDDPAPLARAAAPFGVTYQVSTLDDGSIDVAHTTQLYAVNDQAELVLTWQFGVTIDQLAADFDALLEAES